MKISSALPGQQNYKGRVLPGNDPLKKKVEYEAPIIERTAIGSKPRNKFDQDPTSDGYVAGSNHNQAHTVWRNVPRKEADGSATMVTQQEVIDLTPRSPLKYGGVGALAGGTVGALAGYLASASLGLTPGVGATVGGVGLAALAGGGAALAVAGDKVKLVWDEHQVIDRKMAGYQEFVGPGQKDGQTGYFHRYIADVPEQIIATYQTPRAVHYKGDDEPSEIQDGAAAVEVEKGTPEPAKPAEQPEAKGILTGSGLPRFIERIFEPAPPPLDVTVTFEDQHLQSRRLGSIPYDHWSPIWGVGGYTSCPSGGCEDGGNDIYRDTPVYEPDGEPRVDTHTNRIQARAYSVPGFALGGLALGGGAGYGLGLLASHLISGTASSLAGGIGAGVLGLASAIGAAGYAAGDQVRLEWRELPIAEKELAGYYETVTRHYDTECETECETVTDSEGNSKQECTTECEQVPNGWDYTYTPDVRWWSVGERVVPKVVHYQERDGEWQARVDKPAQDEDQPRAAAPRTIEPQAMPDQPCDKKPDD